MYNLLYASRKQESVVLLPFVCFCCRKIYGLAGLSFLGSTPGYTCALCALRTLAWPMVIHRCAEAGRR
jgi:hypothetical protein